MWQCTEKRPMLLSQYWNNWQFDSLEIISYFGCTNNIFADCIKVMVSLTICLQIIITCLNFYILIFMGSFFYCFMISMHIVDYLAYRIMIVISKCNMAIYIYVLLLFLTLLDKEYLNLYTKLKKKTWKLDQYLVINYVYKIGG